MIPKSLDIWTSTQTTNTNSALQFVELEVVDDSWAVLLGDLENEGKTVIECECGADSVGSLKNSHYCKKDKLT